MDILDSLPNVLGLTPLEIASGYIGGRAGSVRRFDDTDDTPRQAIEEVLIAAFQTGPVCVAFSGGRDSSVILALATHVARREGFPDPVPVTQRFPNATGTDENSWQEMMVAHLGLDSWEILLVGDEIDLLGDLALSLIGRYGPLFPSFGHQLVPLYRAASGSVLLTGEGGDEFFDDRRSVIAREQASRLRHKPSRPNLASLVYSVAPARLRARRGSTDALELFDWLQPGPRREAIRAFSAWAGEEPFVWSQYLNWVTNQRLMITASRAAHLVAKDVGTEIIDVLYRPSVLAALATTRPVRGFRDRSAAYGEIFGSLVPKELLGRKSKAVFNDVTLGPRTLSFIQEWDGTGLGSDLVDPDALRREWARSSPSSGALGLAQVAFLASIA